jgi:hypothetical protein
MIMKFLILLLIPMILISGCSESSISYRTWSIEDNWRNSSDYLSIYPRLTFEYPVCFQEEDSLLKEIYDTHAIRFRRIREDIEERNEQSMKKEELTEILIRLWALNEMERNSKGTFNAAEFLDFYEQGLEEALEESAITGTPNISDLKAVSIRGIYHTEADIDKNIDIAMTITYLEYDDTLIEIIMASPMDEAKEVEEYYNHVLETFRIIE